MSRRPLKNQHVLEAFGLKGRVACITGGNRGIGAEASRALAEAGADIAIIYHSSKQAEAVAEEIALTNHVKAIAYQCDVTDARLCEKTVMRIVQDLGRLDIVVVNAGIAEECAAEHCTPVQYSATMRVNLEAAFFTAQAAAKIFKTQGSGNLIFTASVSAVICNVPQKQAVYNASKAGLVQLAKSLAIEWVDFCRVNCISPGYVATEMLSWTPEPMKQAWLAQIPARRICEPHELKGAYVFCASDASSYMTGAHIVIDGGLSLP